MKKILTIILTIVIFCCCQNKKNEEFIQFRIFLGKQESKALDNLVKSYEIFLSKNMIGDTEGEKTHNFLNYFVFEENINTLPNWIYETKKNREIIHQMDISGIRQEIYLYNNENYKLKFDIKEFIPIEKDTFVSSITEEDWKKLLEEETEINFPDSISKKIIEERIEVERIENEIAFASHPYFNIEGKFLYGLAKHNAGDSLVFNYAKSKYKVDDIANIVIASFLLENSTNKEFEKKMRKYIIVADLYMPLVIQNLKKEE
jgi:hypothetical protein